MVPETLQCRIFVHISQVRLSSGISDGSEGSIFKVTYDQATKIKVFTGMIWAKTTPSD